ncbi:MAG TPA: DinB family protein [Phycisphaerales bacterium]|nr:DinB family protein [Phycisphaerales bacterium]
MPGTKDQIGEMIARGGVRTRDYAKQLLKDIRPADFARKPALGAKAIDTNHPAWVYGHLSIYPARVLGMVGLAHQAVPNPPGFEDLFAMGKPCSDGSACAYPDMEKITTHFFAATDAALAALPGVPDDVFAGPNPAEGRFREMFPTVGSAALFMLNNHPMMHLGQVSAWRRCMGLGPVMG